MLKVFGLFGAVEGCRVVCPNLSADVSLEACVATLRGNMKMEGTIIICVVSVL